MSDEGVPEMVEKVARAICHPLYMKLHPLQPPEVIDQYVEMNWSNHIKQARAAIAAMREPTEGMLDVGGEQVLPVEAVGRASPDRFGARAVFTAMIDAALSPTGDGG